MALDMEWVLYWPEIVFDSIDTISTEMSRTHMSCDMFTFQQSQSGKHHITMLWCFHVRWGCCTAMCSSRAFAGKPRGLVNADASSKHGFRLLRFIQGFSWKYQWTLCYLVLQELEQGFESASCQALVNAVLQRLKAKRDSLLAALQMDKTLLSRLKVVEEFPIATHPCEIQKPWKGMLSSALLPSTHLPGCTNHGMLPVEHQPILPISKLEAMAPERG